MICLCIKDFNSSKSSSFKSEVKTFNEEVEVKGYFSSYGFSETLFKSKKFFPYTSVMFSVLIDFRLSLITEYRYVQYGTYSKIFILCFQKKISLFFCVV